jgi:hypothetical protein
MRATSLVALTLLLTVACGSDNDADGDPGEPSIMYGTKAGGELSVDGSKVGRIFFSFIAPDEPNRAHMFARPDYASGEGVKHYYMSLVFDDAGWTNGHYREAIAGRVAFELSDGRRYAGNARALSVHAEIVRTAVIDGALFPTGRLELTVPAETPGARPLELELTIDNPDALD